MSRQLQKIGISALAFYTALCYFSGQASSQSVDQSIASCLSIEESLSRLECYDEAAGYNPVVTQVDGTGDWEIQLETSKFDDSQTVLLSLESKEWTNCPYDSAKHRLVLACRENSTDLYIIFGGCYMSDFEGGGRVTYRIDNEPAASVSMRASSNNSALGLWDGRNSIPFIKGLLDKNALVVRASPFAENRVTSEFELGGLNEAIKPLRAACNW